MVTLPAGEPRRGFVYRGVKLYVPENKPIPLDRMDPGDRAKLIRMPYVKFLDPAHQKVKI